MKNGKAYNMQVTRRLAAVMILRQQALLSAFAYQLQYLQVLSLYLVLYNASNPLNTRSHALRGNAAPSTQEPGWPGGRSASEGESHNLILRVINPDQPGGCSASESVEQREKEERPCVKEGTLRMPPVVDRIASERYSLKTSANDLGTHYLVGSQASDGDGHNLTEKGKNHVLYAFEYHTTESEIRVAPTTPLEGEPVTPRRNEKRRTSGHGRAHGQGHEKAEVKMDSRLRGNDRFYWREDAPTTPFVGSTRKPDGSMSKLYNHTNTVLEMAWRAWR